MVFEFKEDIESPAGCNANIISIKSCPKKKKARETFYLHLQKNVLDFLEAESGETLNVRFGFISTKDNEEKEALLIVAEQE